MTDQTRLKRLKYRSWHRGTKETDLILGNFSEEKLNGLSDEQLTIYEQLLDEDDAVIWDWLTEKYLPENEKYLPLLEVLKGYGLPNE